MSEAFKVGQKVYDRWWPWRVGIVTKRNKYSLYVQWLGWQKWRYDKDHLQFLAGAP